MGIKEGCCFYCGKKFTDERPKFYKKHMSYYILNDLVHNFEHFYCIEGNDYYAEIDICASFRNLKDLILYCAVFP